LQSQRYEFSSLASQLRDLRIQSNKLNSPATFAEYSLTQRQINKLKKRQEQLINEMSPAPSSIILFTIIIQLPKILLAAFLCYYYYSQSLLSIPFPTFPALSYISPYTPLKYFVGNVSIFAWLLVCNRVSSKILEFI